MSPVHAMERSYGAIKEMLRKGQVASGVRLEANVLAQELGVSMTPVRDALHRLVGERLVEGTSGEGFRVPRYSEANLRNLYEWNAALMILSARTVDISPALHATGGGLPLADRFSGLVERIARLDFSREISVALLNTSDRLQPFRIAECSVFGDLARELDTLEATTSGIVNTLRLLHARRIRAVAKILHQRDKP